MVWATQVHGAAVAVVGRGADEAYGSAGRCLHLGEADALVVAGPGPAAAVLTADCGAVALASPEGVVAAVHAGWRGIVAGVVEEAVQRMRDLGATEVSGALGPCIHPSSYEFSEEDLAPVMDRYGPGVRGRTSEGHPALDLPAAVDAALRRAGVRPADGVDACTAASTRYFSHRARRDAGRQALVVWWSGTASGGPG